jgi:hypothetical protein
LLQHRPASEQDAQEHAEGRDFLLIVANLHPGLARISAEPVASVP